MEALNDEIVFIPMIESVEAIKNLDRILTVKGVDTFLVGPVDLSISLGVPFDFTGNVYQDAEREILDIARRVGKPAGTGVYRNPMNAESLQQFVQKGFIALLIGGDEMLLAEGCRAFSCVMTELREACG
jgi:2-keto-3-deoxy-L-rhamnonate aldolase RhmA